MRAQDSSIAACIAFPTESGCLFDGDARRYRRRKDAVAILLTLTLEHLPRRHADSTRLDPFRLQLFMSRNAERDFAAGRHQQHSGPVVRDVGEHISAS